jgi:hypothetical protein
LTERDDLRHAVDLLVGRVQHWTPTRWSKPDGSGAGRSRGDRVHLLAQRLADAGADAEGNPRRPVPRPENDLVLPDQLRVLTADLLAAGESRAAVLADLVTAVRATAHELT